MLKLLLDRGADPNWGDKLNRTSLHVAVNANSGSSDASAEVEAFLIENGADVYMPDDRKRLPLHYVFVKMGRYGVSDSRPKPNFLVLYVMQVISYDADLHCWTYWYA